MVERLADQPVDMLEINISCPNVKEGGIAFGQDPKAVEAITREVKKHAKQPVIMKLSPNVTDITVMAKAAEAGGADALSLINTLTGMKIDVNKRAFAIANKTGGLSGPAVHPIAVRMVYQVANAVNLPIIGMGGIQNTEDALELILREIKNKTIRSFLYYVPYVTLAVMTFPAIMEATNSPVAGLAALVVGIILAWFGRSLFQVAVLSCVVVFVLELFM